MTDEPDDLGDWFQPVSETLMADPVAGPVLTQLAQDDPDLIAAVETSIAPRCGTCWL